MYVHYVIAEGDAR